MSVPAYPFTAIVGQEEMRLALILNAVNPRLGGVLIRGEKGTAKSTAVRGLASLLPSVDVVDGCRFACDPAPGAVHCPECLQREANGERPLPAHERPAAVVDLPLGATEDRVLGALDLERAIQRGERHFEPGLLARANRGVLYVDEVNLLADHLVDALLDAAAMGTNTVEREGVSFTHPAAFVLVGTMNPEEGELRPQLLDRFALAVEVAGAPDLRERTEVVRRRVAYEADPSAFAERWQREEAAERVRIAEARARLKRVSLPDHLLELIARLCAELGVDGLRGDITLYKTAVTLAAYEGRLVVSTEDVQRAALLALPHRRRRQPLDQPRLDPEQVEEIVRDHEREGPGQGDDPEARNDGGEDGGPDDRSLPPTPEGPTPGGAGATEVFPVGEAPALTAPAPRTAATRIAPDGERARRGGPRAGKPTRAPRGRYVRGVPAHQAAGGALDLRATIAAAAPHQRGRLREATAVTLLRGDLRLKHREAPSASCILLAVDASGSMAARRRMETAKGAVEALLLDAYRRRDRVAFVAFRGSNATLLLPPTSSVTRAHAHLADLPTGGRTPLADALTLARHTLLRQAAPLAPVLVLVSDGRANAERSGADPWEAALSAAEALRQARVSALVVDSEEGPIRLGRAARIAEALGAGYLRLAELGGSPADRARGLAMGVREARQGSRRP